MVNEFVTCQRCGACCRWSGQVRVTNQDITRMAAFLSLGEYQFIQEYTQLAPDRSGLVLKDQAGGACVFLQDNLCRVHDVKPIQCQTFPRQWNNLGWEQHCAAMRNPASDAA